VLAVIALVLGMQARPTVSLDTPLDPASVLTTPVVLSNDGPLALTDVHVYAFVLEINMPGLHLKNTGASGYIPPSGRMEPGEKKTVPIGQFLSYPGKFDKLDMLTVIEFRPAYMPFWRKRREFRFSGETQADGNMRLQQQPVGDAEERFDKAVKELHGNIPGES